MSVNQPVRVLDTENGSTTMDLCNTCIKMLRLVCDAVPNMEHAFPYDLAEWDELPPPECPFCYLRWQMMPSEDRSRLRGRRDVSVKLEANYNSTARIIVIRYPFQKGSKWCDAHVASIAVQPWQRLNGQLGQLGHSTSSIETFIQIQDWIQQCDKTHKTCNLGLLADASYMNFPAGRVLDVNARQDEIKLVDGKEVAPGARYISLSHCWGSFDPPKLCRATIHNFRKGIDLAILPRTFADAVDITRRLDVKYLWIDCLCIVQDDLNDWQIESAKMAQIYAHAWLNIAASKARDSREGCYTDREPRAVRPLVLENLKFQWDYNHPLFSFDQPYILLNAGNWGNNVTGSPLMCRAWVQQENFLSRRKMYFGNEQVFWGCQDLLACEMFPKGITDHLGGFKNGQQVLSVDENDIAVAAKFYNAFSSDKVAYKHKLKEWAHQNKGFDGIYADKEHFEAWRISVKLMRIWHDIVWRYAAGGLTFPEKDKIVAISALAKRCGRGCDYLAGLWRLDLTWQLLWHVVPERVVQNVNVARRVSGLPSWSWTSVDRCCVRVHSHSRIHDHLVYHNDLELITFSSAKTFLASADPFGQVTGGVIELSGSIITIPFPTIQTTIADWGKNCVEERWKNHIYIRDDLGLPLDNALIFCLAVIWGKVQFRNESTYTVQGLWVEPTGQRTGEYRRRGNFILPVERRQLWPRSFQPFLNRPLKSENYVKYGGLELFRGGEIDGKHFQYSITLV